MMNRFSRKQMVIGASILVLFGLTGYGLWQAWPRLTDPYYGLTKTITVQMDDATRVLIQQKLATAQASLAAQQSGTDVDTQLYLVIAENEKMLGDLIASREMYEIYLEAKPTSYTGWNSYAKLLEMMKDLPNAEFAHKKTIELLAAEEYYRDYVEFLQANFPDRRAEVKVLLDESYTKFLQTPWTMVALGDWYFETGDCFQGDAHYDVAIALTPENAVNLKKDQQEKLEICEQPR